MGIKPPPLAAENRGAVKRPLRISALVAIVASALSLVAGVGAAQAASRNPFGTVVVRFAKGTSAAEMRAAVTRAGGDVVTELRRIDAVAAAPLAPDFRTRIRADRRVTAAFAESLFAAPRTPDAGLDVALGRDPALGSPATTSFPDPWHDAASFAGVTNPEGILQWEDNRMNARAAWRTTLGDRAVRVAVLDSGVQGSHKELLSNYDNQSSANLIPCNTLVRDYGAATVSAYGLNDCSSEDTDGHGTWVASRIAGAANGFASNGVAPNVQIAGYKVLASGFGGLTSWIVAGLTEACASGFDLVNLSIGGFIDPSSADGAQELLLWADAVDYCRAQGAVVVGAAGNEHVRVDRVDMTVAGRLLRGLGRVNLGLEGFATTTPGKPSLAGSDYRGLLVVPGGLPGVLMVSATANAIGAAPADVAHRWTAHVGARDQLAYYSNYGSRVDLAAPGGARRYNIPGYDGGPGDILYGGWGSLGALDPSGASCANPLFACFKVTGAGFGWLQGTSMAAPNATGVAALVLSTSPSLRRKPTELVGRLRSTARRDLTNYMGPNDPSNLAPSYAGVVCATGYCHVRQDAPIAFADAYGSGMVNAGAVATP